jgi:hypothetical protein
MSKELLAEPAERSTKQPERGSPEVSSVLSTKTGIHPILQLQRTIGNRRVAQLIQAKRLTPEGRIISVQPKLTVGAADDEYEEEAERVAKQVVAMPDAKVKSAATRISPLPQGSIQSQSGSSGTGSFEADASVEMQLSSTKGSGSPLSDHVRGFMEPRFGVDFSRVRVHTGSDAVTMNRAVGARAFAHGSEIYYGEGNSPSDLSLTAHELTHVVQQNSDLRHSPIQRKCKDCHAGAALCPKCAADHKSDELLQRDPTPSPAPAPSSPALFDEPCRRLLTTSLSLPGFDPDRCSEIWGKKLAEYTVTHADPNAYLQTFFKGLLSDYEDNVAADFLNQLDDLALRRLSASPAGKATLEILYHALMTGNVSGFERTQAAKIEQFGLQGMRDRQTPYNAADTAASATPEKMLEAFKLQATINLDDAAEALARRLRAHIDRDASPYAFLSSVFSKVSSDDLDNVASEFVASLDNNRLDQFAKDQTGRQVLDVLYDALVTGNVSAFEHYESTRILQAKNALTDPAALEKYQQQRKIFPIKKKTPLADCYAELKAQRLSNGKIKVSYPTVRIYECSEFNNDTATLGVSDHDLVEGFTLNPDELVSVHDHDADSDEPNDMPALNLIEFGNESQNRIVGQAVQTFGLGLTFPVSEVSSFVVASRALAIADRIAWALSAVSFIIEPHKKWLASLPGGETLISALNSANQIAGYYGWARLGEAPAKLVAGKLREAWQAGQQLEKKLPAEQAAVMHQINDGLATTLQEADQSAAHAGKGPGTERETPQPAANEGPQGKNNVDPRVAERAAEAAQKAERAAQKLENARRRLMSTSAGKAFAVFPPLYPLQLAFLAGQITARTIALAYYYIKHLKASSFNAFLKALDEDGLIELASLTHAQEAQIAGIFNQANNLKGNVYGRAIFSRLSAQARKVTTLEAVDGIASVGKALDKTDDEILHVIEGPRREPTTPVIEKTAQPVPLGNNQFELTSTGRIGDPPRFRPGLERKYPSARKAGLPGYVVYHVEGIKAVGDELNFVYAPAHFNISETARIENEIRRLQAEGNGELYFEFRVKYHVKGEVEGVTIKVLDGITWKVERRIPGSKELETVLNTRYP